MKKLHILNKNQLLKEISLFSNDDAILLIEDAAYLAYASDYPFLNRKVFVLEGDAISRGMKTELSDEVELINYDDFVELCCQYPTAISW